MADLQQAFKTQCRMCGFPTPIEEYKAIHNRNYRWDFYFRAANLLVEIQGGIHMAKSGHNTGVGIERDAEKINLATCAGYKVMQVTGKMIKDGRAVQWIRQIMETV